MRGKKRGPWQNLDKLCEILEPTPRRRSLAKRIANCLTILFGIRTILWSEHPRPCGDFVCYQLFDYLTNAREQAPQRGRGAYLRRFIEHVLDVTQRYAAGLFHCYDDQRIPQTSNLIEGLNGMIKRNLRIQC